MSDKQLIMTPWDTIASTCWVMHQQFLVRLLHLLPMGTRVLVPFPTDYSNVAENVQKAYEYIFHQPLGVEAADFKWRFWEQATLCARNINTTSLILLTHHSNRHHLHVATKTRTYIILPHQASECTSGGIAKQMARPSVLNSELPKIEYLTPFQQTESIFIWMWNGERMDTLQPLKHTPRNTWLQSQTLRVKHILDIHHPSIWCHSLTSDFPSTVSLSEMS